ncbi:MAG: GTP-binding protein [Deltaproteobacteria bacterium]|nr:GTP-binding protein [Deltaproteobacteria bacterium]
MKTIKKHIPVTLVTGFLGSGKTTLVNRILSEAHGLRVALIINEFGEIGIDDSLIKGTQDFVQMDNGCLCCVLSEELVLLIAKLKQRTDFDAVVLETTGIADPLPIAWPFLREEFEDTFRFAGIVTVVDCLHLDAMLSAAAETKMQIERADYLYLSKTDLCDRQAVEDVKKRLESLNDNARFVMSDDPQWFKLIFEGDVQRVNPEDSHLKAHRHTHGSEGFCSLSVPLKDKKIKFERMEDFFEGLPKEVFRAKAIFKNADDDRMTVMHFVCGRVDFYDYDSERLRGEPAAVFIGKGFDPGELKALFEKAV